MFVPVSCTSCGKPFQVPEPALGQLAPCPWCQRVVTALPVAAPIPPAGHAPPAPTAAPEPLSLDDEPAPDPTRVPADPTAPARRKRPRNRTTSGQLRPADPAAAPKPARLLVPVVGTLALVAVVTAATLAFLNYGSGRAADRGWTEFTPPDGSFTVALPGTPTEEAVDANPAGSVAGGRRYSAYGWYSKTTAWVAYADLDPALVQKLPADRDRVFASGVLKAERDREKARLGATVADEFAFVRTDAWGVELHLDTPRGKAVEWLILAGTGPHPRVYAYGAEAPALTPESPACRRLDRSFRVNP
jgi:hypothetical protein